MIYDVIIIGSGFSGIYTLKHCLDEGLNAIVLEKSNHLGGVWNIDNKPGGVQHFTYSVTSKLYLSPSDFPPPEEWPEFPHSSLVQEHLMDYLYHFGLDKKIRKQCEVKGLVRGEGGWDVSLQNGEVMKARNVVVATGVNTCPSYPKDDVFKEFKGFTVHSHFYNEQIKARCKGKRVLIIGGSDTACDIAGDICKDSKKLYVSIRNGQWFQDRILGGESPADMFYSRGINWMVKKVVGKHYVHNALGENPEKLALWWGKGVLILMYGDQNAIT